MSRHVPLLLSAVAVAILAVLTLRFAQSTDAGSADRAQPVVNIVAAPTIPPVSWQSCPLPPSEAAAIGIGLTMSGTCSGALVEPFSCGQGDEALNGSVRLAVDAKQDFVLTIIVPGFDGAGAYEDAMLFAQLVGPVGVLRWTNRVVPVAVDDEGVIHVAQVDLAAEPGTPTPGLLMLSGSIRCG